MRLQYGAALSSIQAYCHNKDFQFRHLVKITSISHLEICLYILWVPSFAHTRSQTRLLFSSKLVEVKMKWCMFTKWNLPSSSVSHRPKLSWTTELQRLRLIGCSKHTQNTCKRVQRMNATGTEDAFWERIQRKTPWQYVCSVPSYPLFMSKVPTLQVPDCLQPWSHI